MEIVTSGRCVKMALPNHKVADILTPVLDEIGKYLQDNSTKPESGGYILGYQHEKTGNISLETVTSPYLLDRQTRISFKIRDPRHKIFLKRAARKKSYYMGVWHTHPQRNPIPSSIDWDDWQETMKTDKTGSRYVFFLIAGTQEFRVWVGDCNDGKIVEIFECQKNEDGLYVNEMEGQEDKDNAICNINN